MNNNIPDILKLNQPSAKPADVTPAAQQVQIQEENYFVEQQEIPSVSQGLDNEQYLNAINEAQLISDVDYEQMIIEQYERELELAKTTLGEQDEKDGFISDLFNGFKELTGLGVSKSEVRDAIEKQEGILEALKQAQATGNFKEVFEQVTGIKYDEEKLQECHQTEEQLEVIQKGFEEILASNLSDEEKQAKIGEFLLSYQNETGLNYDNLVNQYQELSASYLGGANELTNILNSYVQSQEGFIDKATNFAQIGGMGLMIVGGIACFIPGGAVVGAGMIKAGQVMAMAGTFGDNALEAADLATNDKKFNEEKDEYTALGKETLTEGALFAAGYASGYVAGKAGGYILDKTGKAFLSKAADTALDATLSLASDAAITGEVDFTGEGFSQAVALLTGNAAARMGSVKTDIPVKGDTGKYMFNPETNEITFVKPKQTDVEPIKMNQPASGDNVGLMLSDASKKFHDDKISSEGNAFLSTQAVGQAKRAEKFIGEAHQQVKHWFGGLSTVQESNITARPKGASSIFDKLAKKFKDGKISPNKPDSYMDAIGDVLGTRIQMDSVKPEVTQVKIQDVAKSLEADITPKQLEDYILGKYTPSKDMERVFMLGKGEVLNALKTEQSNEVVRRLTALIKNADQSKPPIITELNNYGGDISSYFTMQQLNTIAKAYQAKYGKALDIVTRIEPDKLPKRVVSVSVNNETKVQEVKTRSANYTDKGALKDSGYTSTQMNVEHVLSDGTVGHGELQIRGTAVNAFADVEHIPYDICKGKIKPDNPKYANIYGLIKGMDGKPQYAQYNRYLTDTYNNLRLRELGFEISDADMPKIETYLGTEMFTPEELALLSREGLEKLH